MKRDIIVIGATAGSVGDVQMLLGGLPGDHPSILPNFLEDFIKMSVETPRDNEKLSPGRIYLASPNAHLIVEKGRVRVTRSPEENLHRPAIDPLFRSAAYYYGPRVSVLLVSKTDCDGTSGLYAIKERGGTSILRDPAEGHMPLMPWSVDRHVAIDYQVPLARLPALLVALAEGKSGMRRRGGHSHAV